MLQNVNLAGGASPPSPVWKSPWVPLFFPAFLLSALCQTVGEQGQEVERSMCAFSVCVCVCVCVRENTVASLVWNPN